MENITSNYGLLHLSEQIFGYLNHETLEVCRKVSRHWDELLERPSHVKYLEEFGDEKIEVELEEPIYYMDVDGGDGQVKFKSKIIEISIKDFMPGWNKAVKTFVKTASLEDLKEVKESMECFLKDKNFPYPVHYAVKHGALKLMQLFFLTEYDFNDNVVLHYACVVDQTELVKLMILSSRELGIDLNKKNENGYTAFRMAVLFGKTEIARLMIQFSKEFDIDLDAGDHGADLAGFDHRRSLFHYVVTREVEMVELMIRSSKEFDISLNSRDNSGATPFQHACEFAKDKENVKLMINLSKEYDIDLNLMQDVDDTGKSVFQWMCTGGFKAGFFGMSDGDRVDVAKLVIEKRGELEVDIYQENSKGETALDELKCLRDDEKPQDPDRLAGYSELIALLEEEYAKDSEAFEE